MPIAAQGTSGFGSTSQPPMTTAPSASVSSPPHVAPQGAAEQPQGQRPPVSRHGRVPGTRERLSELGEPRGPSRTASDETAVHGVQKFGRFESP